MPRYHFHVHDGQHILDTEGTELADLLAARLEAVRYATEFLKDEASQLTDGTDWHMEVTDDRGLVLFRIDFCLTASAAARQDILRGQDR